MAQICELIEPQLKRYGTNFLIKILYNATIGERIIPMPNEIVEIFADHNEKEHEVHLT